MCIKTTQYFDTCTCTVVRTKICISHVEHTHKQIDNNPCPKIEKRFIETKDGGCDFDVPCEMKKEEKWVFASWTKVRGERCFAENGTRFHGEFALIHCVEEGGWRTEEQHACGIGKGWKGEWRHLKGFENEKRQIFRALETYKRRSELRGLVRKKEKRSSSNGGEVIKEEDYNFDSGASIKEEDRMDTDDAIKEEDAMEE